MTAAFRLSPAEQAARTAEQRAYRLSLTPPAAALTARPPTAAERLARRQQLERGGLDPWTAGHLVEAEVAAGVLHRPTVWASPPATPARVPRERPAYEPAVRPAPLPPMRWGERVPLPPVRPATPFAWTHPCDPRRPR